MLTKRSSAHSGLGSFGKRSALISHLRPYPQESLPHGLVIFRRFDGLRLPLGSFGKKLLTQPSLPLFDKELSLRLHSRPTGSRYGQVEFVCAQGGFSDSDRRCAFLMSLRISGSAFARLSAKKRQMLFHW